MAKLKQITNYVRPVKQVKTAYKLASFGVRIYKNFTMSDKGYLTNKREKRFARALDGLFDFRRILPHKKILFGLINIQDFFERRDYNIFLVSIRLVDDGILAKDMNIQAAAVFDRALGYLEENNIDAFNDYVAELLAGRIDIPLVQNDKAIFLNVLTLMKSLIAMVRDKVEAAIAAAEAEEASYKTEKTDE